MQRDDKTYVKFRASRRTVQNTKDLTRLFLILGAIFGLAALAQITFCKLEFPNKTAIECLKPRSHVK